VKQLKSSTPVIVFAHIPLWAVYPEWGWGTDDSEQALGYLKRFGSGVCPERPHSPDHAKGGRQRHIPTRRLSTAFPQPAPGTARRRLAP